MTGNCAACKYFADFGLTYGDCAMGRSTNGNPDARDTPFYAVDHETYRAALRVKPTFGCSKWEPKP